MNVSFQIPWPPDCVVSPVGSGAGFSFCPRPSIFLNQTVERVLVAARDKNEVRGVFPLAHFNLPLFLSQIFFRLAVFAECFFKCWRCEFFHASNVSRSMMAVTRQMKGICRA